VSFGKCREYEFAYIKGLADRHNRDLQDDRLMGSLEGLTDQQLEFLLGQVQEIMRSNGRQLP
jgi:hypothetical protein